MNKSKKLRDLVVRAALLEDEIINSKEYKLLRIEQEKQKKILERLSLSIDELYVEQKGLLSEAENIKSEILKSGEFDSDVLKPKYRNSNYVDVSGFYRVIDNIDEFLAVISITQSVVKNYAKQNKDIKDEVMGCIKKNKPSLIGFEIIN